MNYDSRTAVITLRNNGWTQEQAESVVGIISESQVNLATKNDLHNYKKETVMEVKHSQDLTKIFGSLLCAGMLTALIKLFTMGGS